MLSIVGKYGNTKLSFFFLKQTRRITDMFTPHNDSNGRILSKACFLLGSDDEGYHDEERRGRGDLHLLLSRLP